MPLTKKDKEEIVEIIKATLQNTTIGEAEDDVLNKQAEAWAENSIKSELAGVGIAPADLWITDENGKKYVYIDFFGMKPELREDVNHTLAKLGLEDLVDE